MWEIVDWLSSWNFFFLAPFRGEQIREIGGVRLYMRGSTSDMYVAREVFTWGAYPLPISGIVFDIGANIGAFSIYAAKSARRIFAFEPESENYAQLQKNIALNRATNIEIYKKAIGATHGKALLYRATANTGATSLVSKVSRDTEVVDVITLEEAMRIGGVERIDLLKMDIEGAEYQIFETVSDEVLSRIDAIEIETHPVPGKNKKDIAQRLERSGFTVATRRTSPLLFWCNIITGRRIHSVEKKQVSAP